MLLKKFNVLLFVGALLMSLLVPVVSNVGFMNDGFEVKAETTVQPPFKNAADGKTNGAIEKEDNADATGVGGIVSTMYKFAQTISGIIFGVAVLMIVWAGFKYATSQGDTKVTEQAKMQIITAGIGIGIALFALVIVQIFGNVMGYDGEETASIDVDNESVLA